MNNLPTATAVLARERMSVGVSRSQSVRVAVIDAAPVAMGVSPGRKRSRRSVLAFLAAFLAATAGFGVAADTIAPTLRDPEYGKKRARFLARAAARPGRPVVAVFGSSRTGMGVRPSAVEAGFDPAPAPVVANLSLVGSGPLLQLLAFDRLRRDGFRPAAAVFEFWPPLARDGEQDRDEYRIDAARLFPGDRRIVRDYFRDPDATDRRMRDARLNPWTASRARLIGLTVPGWLPASMRADAGWYGLDGEGWMVGLAEKDVAKAGRGDPNRAYYEPRLRHTVISDEADRAFRELVTRCRADGIPAAFVWLPESGRFREFYSAETESAVSAYWLRLTRDAGVPGIDCRRSVPDAVLPDGIHLTQTGAMQFGPVFAGELSRVFPHLGGNGR